MVDPNHAPQQSTRREKGAPVASRKQTVPLRDRDKALVPASARPASVRPVSVKAVGAVRAEIAAGPAQDRVRAHGNRQIYGVNITIS